MAAITSTAAALRSATTRVNVSAATAPVSGQVLTATSTTAATWQTPSGSWTMVKKASDQTKNSDTTLAADSALQFSMSANTRYTIRFHVAFSTTATPDFKFDLDGPVSPTSVQFNTFRASHSGATVSNNRVTAFNASTSVTNTADGYGYIMGEGYVYNGANSGTFSFRWAQDTSDAGNTTVLKGSYIEYLAT